MYFINKHHIVGNRNIYGIVYLKYVFAGPTKQTKIEASIGSSVRKYFLLLLCRTYTLKIKSDQPLNPILDSNPTIGIYGKVSP